MIARTLLRHGRTEADDQDRYESRWDAPLTDVGRSRAARLPGAWKREPARRFDVVLSSPLRRAADTADILADYDRAPLVLDQRLLELDARHPSRMPRSQGLQEFPMRRHTGPYDRIVKVGARRPREARRLARRVHGGAARGPGRQLGRRPDALGNG
jgi:2,3-bisphosphoglycerate-dependent phosphoglycerate mutase